MMSVAPNLTYRGFITFSMIIKLIQLETGVVRSQSSSPAETKFK